MLCISRQFCLKGGVLYFFRSIATMRTSRNRKKQERKKYVLKEGSRYEDLALIIALGEVASSSDKLQGKLTCSENARKD